MIIGITVLPARLIRFAPAGAFTAPARLTCVKRFPLTMNVAFSIGARPSPMMTRAPSNTVTAGACAKIATAEAVNTAASTRSFVRYIINHQFLSDYFADNYTRLGSPKEKQAADDTWITRTM